MIYFDDYLINNISQYLNFESYNNLKKVNLRFTQYQNSELDKLYFLKKKVIEDKFNCKIIDLFGGINKFLDYPMLNWNDDFLGNTGYIDKIKTEHINNPIMYGFDCYNRPYITLKFIEGKPKVITLFQRYDDYKDAWTNGTLYNNDVIKYCSPFMSYNNFTNENTIENIKNLINNKNFIKIFNMKTKCYDVKENVYLIY